MSSFNCLLERRSKIKYSFLSAFDWRMIFFQILGDVSWVIAWNYPKYFCLRLPHSRRSWLAVCEGRRTQNKSFVSARDWRIISFFFFKSREIIRELWHGICKFSSLAPSALAILWLRFDDRYEIICCSLESARKVALCERVRWVRSKV